jgi:hypothetical protein
MEFILDSQGELVAPELYKIKTSKSLTGLLLNYIYELRLNKIFDSCKANKNDDVVVVSPHHQLQWEVQKHAIPICSDMFWVSPANEDDYLPVYVHCVQSLSTTLLPH